MIETKAAYLKPETIGAALKIARKSDGRFIAGGTDFFVNKFQGNEPDVPIIDLSDIPGLKEVSCDSGYLKIGALVTLEELQNIPEVISDFPILVEAARSVASPVIRKTATLGGNLLCENRCTFYNQSAWWRDAVGYCLKCVLPDGKEGGDICIATGGKKACFSRFVSDLAPALISLDAEIVVHKGNNSRRAPLENLYTGDGVKPRHILKNEIISAVMLPLNRTFRSVFKKLRMRESLDFTSLTACVSIDGNGKIKAVLGGVDPGPVTVEAVAGTSATEIIKRAVKKSRIVDNDVFSRKYRKEMIPVFLKKIFYELNYK